MTDFAVVFGNSKGVVFHWRDVEFVLDLARCSELVDLIEVAQSTGSFEDDDCITDLWVGKNLLRYGGKRIPIDLKVLYPNLLTALQRHQSILEDAESLKSAESALKDIADGLGLDK